MSKCMVTDSIKSFPQFKVKKMSFLQNTDNGFYNVIGSEYKLLVR